jgi:hypothetical protein
MMMDSMPDGFLADGLIVFGGPVGGLISAGFELEFPNLQSASGVECNLVQDAVSTLPRQMGEGMSVQVILSQAPLRKDRLLAYQRDTASCQTETSRLLRNSNFIHQCKLLEDGKLLEKRVFIFASIPTPKTKAALPKGRNAAAQYDLCLAAARAALTEFQQSLVQALRPIGVRVTWLTDNENARLWADAFNPSLSRQASYDPAAVFDPSRSLLDNFFNSELRGRGRQGFVLDSYSHLGITLRRLPTETYFTIVGRLAYLPFSDFTHTVHLRRLSRDDVIRRTQSSLHRLHAQLSRRPDERQAVTVRQMEEMVRRLASGESAPLEMETIFLVRAKTDEELAAKAAAIKSTLYGMNGAQYYEAVLPATARNLFAKTLPGWTGSPHQGFRLYCEERTLADLLPLCSSFCGHPGPVQALFPGNDNNQVNCVMFLGEGNAETPQNYIFVGAPGVGKSELLGRILTETDYLFSFSAIIEEGLSQAPYTRSHGLEPVIFRIDGTQTINPLDTQGLPRSGFSSATQTAIVARMVGLPGDEEKAAQRSALISRHLCRLCDDHAEEQLRNWPPEKRKALLRHALALDYLRKCRGISEFEAFGAFSELRRERPSEAEGLLNRFSQAELDEFESREAQSVRNLVFAYLRPDEHLTLSSLREHFELAEQDEEQCRLLATLLSPWCRGGNYGVMFDGASNVSLTGPVVHFELGLIPEAAKEIKGVIGLLIINLVRNHVLNMPHHLRKRVVVEEFSRFLDFPGGPAILRELFEQFRKFKVQVIIVAQQYARIADTPIRAALMGNARAWFIFNTGDIRDVERLCHDLGLSSVARDTILHYPRPDQQTGPKYSEFLYYHTDAQQPICGTVRYVRLLQPSNS